MLPPPHPGIPPRYRCDVEKMPPKQNDPQQLILGGYERLREATGRLLGGYWATDLEAGNPYGRLREAMTGGYTGPRIWKLSIPSLL